VHKIWEGPSIIDYGFLVYYERTHLCR